MSFLLFLINLVWLLDMGKLKISIFLKHIKTLILLLWSLSSKSLSERITLVLSNTRELDRVPSTK